MNSRRYTLVCRNCPSTVFPVRTGHETDTSNMSLEIVPFLRFPMARPLFAQSGLQYKVVGKTSAMRKSRESYRADATILRDAWLKKWRMSWTQLTPCEILGFK